MSTNGSNGIMTNALFRTDWFDECSANGEQFPSCEHLFRDNWLFAVPLDVTAMHAGLREQERIEPERLIGVSNVNGHQWNPFVIDETYTTR